MRKFSAETQTIPQCSQVTQGQSLVTDEWTTQIYDELRWLAASYLEGERNNHSLQPTALVNEAYLRLSRLDGIRWNDRLHFFIAAAGTIRRILVDHARSRGRQKRRVGGTEAKSAFKDAFFEEPDSYLDLEQALQRLGELDEQMLRVVELRFFAGLTIEQTALATQMSATTVKEKWSFARTWLQREMHGFEA